MENFSKVFGKLIKDQGVTYARMSEATGIPKATLSRLVNGGEPKAGDLLRLARFFGVSMEYLLLGEESREPGQLAVQEDAVAYRIRRKERLNEILSRFEALNDQLSDLLDEDGKTRQTGPHD